MMIARLRRWLRGDTHRWYTGPGVVVLPLPDVPHDKMPPSVAITVPYRTGGPVARGRAYVVGEQGPTYIVTVSPGRIDPV